MTRLAFAVSAVVMVGGCADCGGPKPVDCTQTTLTFETPESGATVESPFAVAAVVKAADGSVFPIDAATLAVGGMSFTGTVDGNRATFSGVTAAVGAQTLTVSIAAGTCSKTYDAPLPVTVRDACANAAVSSVSFPQDTTAPLGVLNNTEVPQGTNLQMRVNATCVTGVQVRIKRGTAVVGALTSFTNGVATVTMPTLPDSDNARYDLFAELVRDGVAINTTTGNAAANGTISVQRAAPMVALTVAPSFGPGDDADLSTPGVQIRITGTAPVGASCSIGVTGQTPVASTPTMSGDVSADFTLTSGSYTATLTCVDAAGNTGTATAPFVLDFDPPVVTISAPANVDGGATMLVTQSPLAVVVTATGAEDGSLVEIFRNGTSVGTSMIQNGTATLPVSFGVDGSYTIRVTVTDGAGNVGSSTISVDVTLDGCGAAFTRPATCPALLTPAQLQSGAYTFQTGSKANCAGQTATLFRIDVGADGGMSSEVVSGATTLSGAGVANYPPVTLASGDYLFRADVVNVGVDAGVSQATSCRITVDLDGPAITSPVPSSGRAVLTATQDTQLGTPGVQRSLTFSARVPVGGRVDVCTTQAVDPVTSAQRQASPECGTGWYRLQQGVSSPTSGFTFPEGSYDIKVVVIGGGTFVASAAVSILSDATRPCPGAITFPQDLNGDGRLNIAELNGAAPRLEFQPGCGDVGPATLDPTSPVVIRDVTGGVAGAVRPSSSSFASGKYTVTLSGAYSAEVDLNLFVELTDLAGNKNLFNTPVATAALRVDPTAPTCQITSPNAAQTIFNANDVPGGAFSVNVATSADVGTNGVTVNFTGQAARSVTPVTSQVVTTYSLSGDATYTVAATCTDLSGNATTATPRTTRVDLAIPTCSFSSPADGATVGLNDVPVTVAIGGVTAGDPTSLVILSTAPGISGNVLPISGATATGTVSFVNGTQDILVNYSDLAGNLCVAPSGLKKAITITVAGTCGPSFAAGGPIRSNTNGNWLNRAGAGLTGTNVPPSVSTAVAIASDCGGGKNVYLNKMALGGTPTGSPVATLADGSITLPAQTFLEGEQWTVSLEVSTGVYRQQTFFVSLKIPAIASIGLQRSASNNAVISVPANTSLTFGAASANRRVETALATDYAFGDLDGTSTDGADFQLTLGAITDGMFGTQNGQLEILGVTPATPAINVNLASFVATVPRLKLAHQVNETTIDLVLRVTSPSGNVYESRHTSEVDVIAPATPALIATGADGGFITDVRAATVALSWAPVYDDGSTNGSGGLTGGPVSFLAGYDVRWSTSSVPSNNALAADTDYFGSSSKAEGITTWSASNITKNLTLPPINTYFVSVRARDEVGNYSPYTAPLTATNPWTPLTLTVAGATADFGQTVLASNNVAGSAANDIVISAPSRGSIGSVYVFQGSSTLASQSTCGAGCQELTPPDNTGTNFGSDVSVAGNVGDDASDATTTGMSDVLIGQRSYSTTGRAFIYFGSTGSISKTIEIRGDAANVIGWTSTIIKDLDGDGLDEVALPAYLFNGGRGRIYVFKGRSFANWQAAFVSGQQYIAVTSANWVIEGEYLYAASPVNTSNGLGLNRMGVATLPNVTGRKLPDGGSSPELVVSIPRSNVSRVAIYGGDQVVASSLASPLGAFDGGVQVLAQSPTASNSIVQGFGAAVSANGPVQRLDLADLYVGFPAENRVYRYSSWGTGGATGGVATEFIQGASSFGVNVTSGDLNADGKKDLVVGEGLAAANGLWVLYQQPTGFDSPVGGANAKFFVSQIRPVRAGGLTNQMPNRFVAVGDVGFGFTSLLAADSASGSVFVWK